MNTDFQAGLMMGILIAQNQQMQALIDAQKETINLQKQIQAMTPPQPEPHEVFFHMQKNMFAEDAAASNDVKVVEMYRQWVFDFTKKFVMPYVNQRVYQEVSVHMLRGVAHHLAELQTLEDMKRIDAMRKAQQAKQPPASVN